MIAMAYELEITSICQRRINKACNKNPVLRDALERKINEVREDPNRFKPLRYDLAGERSAHILKSFVLFFRVEGDAVFFDRFRHHDDACRR